MRPGKKIECLIEIMAALRDPVHGCKWDIEQSYETIIPHTIEEVYEVADAISSGDRSDLCDELGDLLLQVVYFAQIASEEKSFDFSDIVFAITSKMIRRHPHVFGNNQQRANGLIEGEWERIKIEEKKLLGNRRKLAGLPEETQNYIDNVKISQPSMSEAQKLLSHAARVGFEWPSINKVIDKINEEYAELLNAIEANNREEIESEIGDLFFVIINLARKFEIQPENALKKTNKKFRSRFRYIEENLHHYGTNLEESSLELMEKLWNKAKLSVLGGR